MKTVKISYSIKGIKNIDKIKQAIPSKGLYEYIAKKCIAALKEISLRSLSTYSEENIDTSYYVNNHKYEIDGDILYIYNDSTIDISGKNMSETKKSNYPAQLSLSKIVEYGIGYTGKQTDQTDVEDWEYDVNEHGTKGWYYLDDSGNIKWTKGFTGRLIFSQLRTYVEENAREWITEYLNKYIIKD